MPYPTLIDNKFQIGCALAVFLFEQNFANFQLARRVHKNYNRKKGGGKLAFHNNIIGSLDHYLIVFLMEIWATLVAYDISMVEGTNRHLQCKLF